MSITNFGPRFVQQTTDELERELTHWIDWLRSSRRLAFGDNPRPVYELEDNLSDLIERFERLRPFFGRNSVAPEAVTAYRHTRDQLCAAIELVVNVRMLDRGSTEFTRKLLQQLMAGRAGLQTLADTTSNSLRARTAQR